MSSMIRLATCKGIQVLVSRFLAMDSRYSQLLPCGHLAITNTLIKWTAAKSPAKTNYRHLTEINSCYYGLSLMRTLTQGPYSVRNKGS